MASDFGPNSELIERFLKRFAELDLVQLTAVCSTWRAHLKRTDEWYRAEDEVGDAIAHTQRYDAQWRLQDRLYELFRRSSWYTNLELGTLIPTCEAASQYLASIAAFAVLVADAISPRDFATLYTPFAETITLHQLGVAESGVVRVHQRPGRPPDGDGRKPLPGPL